MVTMRPKAGFTLMEAMLSVAIVGIVSGLGATLLLQANRYFVLGKARADLQKEARGIMYIMTRELRQAQNSTILISRASNSQPYYSRINFTKQQGTVVTLYQNGNLLCLATKASAFTLTQGGQPVCRTSGGGVATTLTKNLRYLAFTFPRSDDMTILSVSMTIQTSIYQGKTKALHMASENVRVMD